MAMRPYDLGLALWEIEIVLPPQLSVETAFLKLFTKQNSA
jgi:hypothetical protein